MASLYALADPMRGCASLRHRVPDHRVRPLRVGLNLIFLQQASGGAGRYARELPGALLAAEPETEIHVFVSRDAPEDLQAEPWAQAVRWVHCPIDTHAFKARAHLIFQFTALPLLAAARRLDVLHSPANVGPVRTPRVASVLSLLDVIWMLPPEAWGEASSGRAHCGVWSSTAHATPIGYSRSPRRARMKSQARCAFPRHTST